jgi:hypothetical protein
MTDDEIAAALDERVRGRCTTERIDGLSATRTGSTLKYKLGTNHAEVVVERGEIVVEFWGSALLCGRDGSEPELEKATETVLKVLRSSHT